MTATDLQALLDAHQLKPAQLARGLKLGPDSVHRWRTGKRPISEKTAQRIFAYLGITVCPMCGRPDTEESNT